MRAPPEMSSGSSGAFPLLAHATAQLHKESVPGLLVTDGTSNGRHPAAWPNKIIGNPDGPANTKRKANAQMSEWAVKPHTSQATSRLKAMPFCKTQSPGFRDLLPCTEPLPTPKHNAQTKSPQVIGTQLTSGSQTGSTQEPWVPQRRDLSLPNW